MREPVGVYGGKWQRVVDVGGQCVRPPVSCKPDVRLLDRQPLATLSQLIWNQPPTTHAPTSLVDCLMPRCAPTADVSCPATAARTSGTRMVCRSCCFRKRRMSAGVWIARERVWV